MPTIEYLSSNNTTHNLTSYIDNEDAQKDLFAWQYVSSRLFKVSNDIIPSQFRFIGQINQSTDNIHNILFNEYTKRSKKNTQVISIDSFLSSNLIKTVKNKAMVPSSFEKDYLLLDLLLTNQVLKEHGINSLSDYSKSLLNFVKNLTNKELQDININIELVNDIITTDTNNLTDHNNKTKYFEQLLEQGKKQIESQKEEIDHIHSIKEKLETESQYIDNSENFSHEKIELLKINRLKSDNNNSLINKLQLKVFKFLGKSTSSFYKDGLESLEEQLETKLINNKLKFNSKVNEIDKKISLINESIQNQKNKNKDLEQVLQSISYSSILLSQHRTLDNDYVRDVSHIMKNNNSIFLHSISDIGGIYPEDNSPLQKNVTLSDKIDQIRTFNPSLSCSSFQLDSNRTIREFASAYGVIINDGSIQSALGTDAGTTVSLTGERAESLLDSQMITDIISKKNNSQKDCYDEFAISNTKIAGIYLNYDRIKANTIDTSPEVFALNFMKITEKLKSYQDKNPDILLMIIKDGNIHEITPKFSNYNKTSFNKTITELQNNVLLSQSHNLTNETLSDPLNHYFNISSKKTVNDIIKQTSELSLEQKLEKGLSLIDNYKLQHQEHIWKNIETIKSRISSLRDKYLSPDDDAKKTPNL